MKEIELIGKRKEREKHFLKDNGVIVANVYEEDIHFLKNGKYEEIDNTLVDEGDYYTNKSNAYKVCFAKVSGDELIEVRIGENYIKTSLIHSNATSVEEIFTNSNLRKKIRYSNVLEGIDLIYNVEPNKVKENVILKDKNANLEKLEFLIETNMELELINGKIHSKKEGRTYFKFDLPYMFDDDYKINDNVNYELTKIEDTRYKLKIKVDKDWLKDDQTKYPVTIDPTITNAGQDESVYDTQISPGDEHEDYHGTASRLRVGMISTSDGYVPIRSLFKFSLPTIGTGSQIINATMSLIGYPEERLPFNSDILTVHQLTNDWTETDARWNNMNDKYNPKVEGIIEARCSYLDGDNVITPSINDVDITRLVRKWYTDTPNYGVMLKQNEEKYNPDFIAQFFSKDNNVMGSNPKPILSVSYRNQNGIEDYMDYQQQSFSEGMSYVNNYNGNLTATFDIGETISGKMPVGLSLVYNTNDVILNNDYGYGLGYKLNLHQIIKEQLIDEKTYLEYCDADGTLHYFLNQKTTFDDQGYNTTNTQNVYYDEDGLNMTITKNSDGYVLKDKNGNTMKFIKQGSTAYLSQIEDVSGNKNIIDYDTNKKIVKITDANNSEINISYKDNAITVVSPDQTVTLSYLNNKLKSMTYLLGTIYLEYNENNIISGITDINAIKTTYEYYEQKPYKIKKVCEYGKNNTLGEYYEASYDFDSTTITDSKGNAKNIIFNDQGSVVSISVLKGKNHITDAYGISQINGTNDGTNPGYNNKLLNSQIPLKYVNNLLSNTSFESGNVNFTGTNDVNISISDEASETGINSLKVVNTSTNQELIQTINVSRGNYYTFSSYIKNTGDVSLCLSYLDSNGLAVESQSEVINPSEKFERYDVTIDYPDNATSDLILKINLEDVGTTYVDDVQLETGEVANNYNLLENSDFSSGYSDWNLSAHNNQTGEEVSTSDKFQIVSLDNDVKALKTKLNPIHTISMEKVFNIKGKGGDTFNVSFWYKNEGIDSNMSEHYGSRVYVIFNYNDSEEMGACVLPSPLLNINDKAWQYVSNNFVAERNYSSITLRLTHEYNANDFYVTNMSLFKDIRSVNYEYDEFGNVITSDDLDNNKTNFNYDKNNQLINMTNPKGKNFAFEYDNKITDRVINGISDMGISNQVKYDSNNNPVLTRIIKNNIQGIITNGLYKIRLKGTNKYLRNISNEIKVKDECCTHDLWKFEKVDQYFKIYHSIITKKFFTIFNNTLLLGDYNEDNSLFELKKNQNGSYLIKLKSEDKYLKYNDSEIEISTLVEDDYHFEFYFETSDSDLFIENKAEYTEDGRFIKSTTDSLGNVMLYDIDETTGLMKRCVDSNGNITNYLYNDKKQIASIKSNGMQVDYVYNDENGLYKLIHGNKKYVFNYDDFMNLSSVRIGDNTIINNSYYPRNGLLKTSDFGDNQIIKYYYDALGRIIAIEKVDNIINYKYDSNGNLKKIVSNDTELKYNYDLSKRLSEYSYDDFKIKYRYDSLGNITDIKYNLGDNVSYAQNVFNEDSLITKFNFNNDSINYEYDDLGRIACNTINNTFLTNYEYAKNGFSSSFVINKLKIGNDVYYYKYDKSNNIKCIYFNNKLVNKYNYDKNNQLIKENNLSLKITIRYKYDKTGNLISRRVYNFNTYDLIHQDKYVYNANWEDQLVKFNEDIIVYDSLGNPIKIGKDISLCWINGRELSSYSDSNNLINYKYNHDGVRISKKINGIETKYFLEGRDIVFEKTGNNTIYYIRNMLNDLIGFKYNELLYYYVKNAQNDIIGIMDTDYNIIARYMYDSWGNIYSITDEYGNDISNDNSHIANINPFRYRSYYYDNESKFYYLNSRYYNPLWGRFLTIDSLLNPNQDIISHNLYVYCSNNPIKNTEKEGKSLFIALVNPVAKAVINLSNAVTGAVEKSVKKYIPKPTKKTDMCNPITSYTNACAVKDYTEELYDILDKNNSYAKKMTIMGGISKPVFFYVKEKPGGDWDYKRKDIWSKEINVPYLGLNTPFEFDGYIIDAEDWGNIHYGYVGTSLGFPPKILFMAGGYAAKGLKTEIFKGPYYGDTSDDHCAIQFGIDLYNSKNK